MDPRRSRNRSELQASLARSFPKRIRAIDTIVAFISIDLGRAPASAQDADDQTSTVRARFI